jgi:hypothetical protein
MITDAEVAAYPPIHLATAAQPNDHDLLAPLAQ